jgi:transcriptional regulator with XRE-family HTH domain
MSETAVALVSCPPGRIGTNGIHAPRRGIASPGFGKRVKAARQALGWSTEDLATRAGCHRTTVNRLENGDSKIRDRIRRAVRKALAEADTDKPEVSESIAAEPEPIDPVAAEPEPARDDLVSLTVWLRPGDLRRLQIHALATDTSPGQVVAAAVLACVPEYVPVHPKG